VAECIGGTGAARDYTLRALNAGKSVVTSNKEVVAEYGDEFLALAREKNLNYLYEASVGGGIPIIRPLSSCLAANEITEIYGILNGTTNYILTKMIKEGLSFDTALAQAQEKGYAEADPTADVEGFDACRKICILASLSFGRHVYPSQVPTQGITGVTAEDVALAEAAGKKIKLLGRAVRQENGKVVAYVAPHLLPEDHQLAGVEDVFNGIVVCGNVIGDVMFYGRGAGKLPTASAVSADVLDAVKHKNRRQNMDWLPGGEDVVGDYTQLPLRWYIRTEEREMRIGTVFGDVEMVTVPTLPGQTALFTGELTRQQLEEKLQGFEALTCLPVLA
jgi:homoserine dehydrogenase